MENSKPLHGMTKEERRMAWLSYPYNRKSQFVDLSQEQIDVLEQIKPMLNGFSHQEANDIVEVLKSQLTYMSVVSIP